MNNANKKAARKSRTFAPAAWQWDAAQLVDDGNRIQLWSRNGCLMGLVTVQKARELVTKRAFFIGSNAHLCQVHEAIDGVNAY
jgi:hypothetical protein